MILTKLKAPLLNAPLTGIYPLVTFRILFGTLMAIGAVRFMVNGWIERLYSTPQFFFKYTGFDWVPVPGTGGMYLLFSLIALSAVGIALGWQYRLSAIVFFITFTWAELTDATNYLNHYYLVILLACLLMFLPAHRALSLDARRRPSLVRQTIPFWCIALLRIQIGIVYFFAGLAKLNPDWLIRAMPLAVWLPEHSGMPLLGPIFSHSFAPHLMSWAGALYDLSIPFLLMFKPTRPWAYLAVVVFHLLTALLFNIGLFPAIMITSTLIFFPNQWHKQLFQRCGYRAPETIPADRRQLSSRAVHAAVLVWIVIQIFLPFRHLAYPGDVLWTEEGYRFSWRVMLVEKSGWVRFTVTDASTGRRSEIINRNYLTAFQEKQMAIQPDFMVQFAKFLASTYKSEHGFIDPVVTADSHVALNGRTSQRLIDPSTDLSRISSDWAPRPWILDRSKNASR